MAPWPWSFRSSVSWPWRASRLLKSASWSRSWSSSPTSSSWVPGDDCYVDFICRHVGMRGWPRPSSRRRSSSRAPSTPGGGPRTDTLVALAALVTVVGASVAMEQGAASLGAHYGVADIVVGALVLAAVTSLPNAVAAVFLARRGRGAAALSTALNSNTVNVVAGLLVPAAVLGLAQPSASGLLIGGWYVGMTALTLLLAYLGRGLRRWSGWLIIAAYVLFVVAVLASA